MVFKLFFVVVDGITKTSVQCLLHKQMCLAFMNRISSFSKENLKKGKGKMLLFIIVIVNKQRYLEGEEEKSALGQIS